MSATKIIYTHTDEAPALATESFLPIIEVFAGAGGVEVETSDISLAGRILANFGDHLTEAQRVPDALSELGQLALTPEANIIKLPNISASIPQLKAAVAELQAAGYALPDYPDEPDTPELQEIQTRYDKVKGSAVNPVLREGNSDRRAPKAVKQYARNNPHSMGQWSPDSKTHVATMSAGDFRSNEASATMADAGELRIELVAADGTTTVLKKSVPVLAGEVVDATFMSRDQLVAFLQAEIAEAKRQDVLFSIHLKATMMKVSDPIIFGHAVRAYFADGVRSVRRRARGGRCRSEQRARPGSGHGRSDGGPAALGDRRRHHPGTRNRAGHGDGRLRSRYHQPPRTERCDHRRFDAGHDPDLGPDVERRQATSRTPRPSSPTAATPVCTRKPSSSAAGTGPSTRPRWVRCPTSG